MGYRPSFKISVAHSDMQSIIYGISDVTLILRTYYSICFVHTQIYERCICTYIYIYDHPLTVGVLVQYVCSIHSVHVYKTANVGYMKFHYDLLYEPQVIRGTYSTAARTTYYILCTVLYSSTASSLHHFDQFFNKNYFNIFQNSK